MKLRFRKIGNTLAAIWPKALLRRRTVKKGGTPDAVEAAHGVPVTPHNPAFDETMATARRIMARDREALRALAD